ncbi:MAG: glycosyltransferase family 2 protein, partial [Opitutaceae bacterium]
MSLSLFSVIVPARDEEASLPPTLRAIYAEFAKENVPNEIVAVDDGSRDSTWQVLQSLKAEIPTLVPVQNLGLNGFGRAVVHGINHVRGDAVVIMMADASDLP